jgi:hypothetical protein
MDPWLARYSPLGAELWAKTDNYFITDNANGVAVDAAGNLFAAGRIEGTGSYAAWLRMYTPSGNEVWEITYDSPSVDLANAVAVRGGAAVMAGWSSSDAWVGKYDTTPALVWSKSYDGGSNDIAEGVAIDPSGNIVIAGTTAGPGLLDALIVKYDGSGNQLWVVKHDGADSGIDRADDVVTDSQGNVIVSGHVTEGGQQRIWLAKYDPSGNPLWSVSYAGGMYATGQAVAVDQNDNVVLLDNTWALRKFAP